MAAPPGSGWWQVAAAVWLPVPEPFTAATLKKYAVAVVRDDTRAVVPAFVMFDVTSV